MNRATIHNEPLLPPVIIDSTETLGAQIRSRRKELHIRQADLAEACGISPRLLGDIERGKAGVAIAKILLVVNTIGLDLAVHSRGRGRSKWN